MAQLMSTVPHSLLPFNSWQAAALASFDTDLLIPGMAWLLPNLLACGLYRQQYKFGSCSQQFMKDAIKEVPEGNKKLTLCTSLAVLVLMGTRILRLAAGGLRQRLFLQVVLSI